MLGTAIGIGTGGAAVAAATGPGLRWGITAAFGLSAAVALAALAVTRRLPAGLTGRPVSRRVDQELHDLAVLHHVACPRST